MARTFNVSKVVAETRAVREGSAPSPAEASPEPATAPEPRPAPKAEKTTPKRTAKPRQKPAQKSTQTASDTPPRTEREIDEELLNTRAVAKLTRRIHLPLTEDMYRTLKRSGAEDDIDTTVRIRSMVELYQADPKVRARVDKLARRRNEDLIRNRWPTSVD